MGEGEDHPPTTEGRKRPPAVDHHPCARYLETIHVPDLKVKQCRPHPLPPEYVCRTSVINAPPDPCYEQKVYVKKCTPPPPPPPPPPPDPCKEQKIRLAIKAGRCICPAPPPPPPPEPEKVPSCLAICIEKVKNMPVKIKKEEERPKCPKQRVLPTMARCDELLERSKMEKPIPWPCPVYPPLPPPQVPSPCDSIREREKKELCHERLKQYSSDLPQNRAGPGAKPRKKENLFSN